MREKKTVLIVEDETVNRKILHKILEENYAVIEAENGADAWEILTEKKDSISAILLDVIMPVMNGYQLLSRMVDAQMADIPIIVATGASDEESEQRALDAGAWDFITKPYNSKVLKSRLRNAIARSEVSAYEKLQRMAEHDPLTGLHTRSRMFSDSRRAMRANPERTFAFVRMDIDRFSLFNSSFGEAEGNNLLKYTARCLEEAVHGLPFCNYGRMNADIFCICFCVDDNCESLSKRIDELQQHIAACKGTVGQPFCPYDT